MREANQFNLIQKIITAYQPDKPLHRFLKEFFRQHPQMGSRDRRLASQLVYNFFRLGKAMKDGTFAERMATACFLCETELTPLIEFSVSHLKFNLNADAMLLPIRSKLDLVQQHYPTFRSEDIFPFHSSLSEEINKEEFILSHFIQPKLWIRVREAYRKEVLEELYANHIEAISDKEAQGAYSLPLKTSLKNLSSYRKGYFEIQDLSSQTTGKHFDFPPLITGQTPPTWWDCCAGSGGKSLLLIEKTPSVRLFVSDTRPSILKNLQERFTRADFHHYIFRQLDLSGDEVSLPPSDSQFPIPSLFDGIIVDAPCSGSGTWGRAPENLSFFDETSLSMYAERQKRIVTQAAKHLKKGMPLIYITCSVFKQENEAITSYMTDTLKLTRDRSETIPGSLKGADTMYVCRMTK